MTTVTPEQIVLARYREKCRMAGGPRPGFVLRRKALLYVQGEYPDADLDAGIASLESQGLLTSSESGDFVFLTGAGVERLTGQVDPE